MIGRKHLVSSLVDPRGSEDTQLALGRRWARNSTARQKQALGLVWTKDSNPSLSASNILSRGTEWDVRDQKTVVAIGVRHDVSERGVG